MPTPALPLAKHISHPALRHLRWMLDAPQLLPAQETFSPISTDTSALVSRLQALIADPAQLPDNLTTATRSRLGLYFEDLYAYLLSDLLGWQLMARNLPVRADGRTLGELDFLLRNPQSGAIEHHEIAIKFYLGFPQHGLWYGPNASDRLDLKSKRLLEHQCGLSSLLATRDTLSRAGLPCPDVTRIFMPGYLFYPAAGLLQAPQQVSASHLRGHWHRVADVSAEHTHHWVVLKKPHWLGPWQQASRPDPNEVASELKIVADQHSPRLFACLSHDAKSDLWHEQSRHFVVPSTWPAIT